MAARRAMHLARVAYDQARAAGLAANTLRISAQVGTSLLRGAAPWAEAFPVEPPPWVLEALRPVHSSTYLFITVMNNQPNIFFVGKYRHTVANILRAVL